MAKRITHDLTYDAPLADVAAMLADPAFREEVCDDQRRAPHSVAIEPDGDAMKVPIDQVQAADRHPVVREEVRRRRDPHRPEGDLDVRTDGDIHVTHPRQARAR